MLRFSPCQALLMSEDGGEEKKKTKSIWQHVADNHPKEGMKDSRESSQKEKSKENQ